MSPEELWRRIDPGRAALLVIDMQNDFCHSDGVWGRSGRDLSSVQAMTPRLERMVASARRHEVPPVFVQMTQDEHTVSRAWMARKASTDQEATIFCRPGSWGAEWYGVAPLPSEPVVSKHRFSGFIGTNLDLVLRSMRRESLLFAGIATNICVESTLRDALALDYDVLLISDCTATLSVEQQRATERNVSAHFGGVVDSRTVMDLWGGRQAFGDSSR